MEKTNLNSWKTLLTGESLLFGVLGKLLYQEPDKQWLETLISDAVFEEVPFGEEQSEIQNGLELMKVWSEKNKNGISVTEFDLIKQEHLKLFIGMEQMVAPPWESVYFSKKHMVFQEQTLQVREWYSRFGLQFERINREPDDQIGLEMIFVAHLAMNALQTINDDDQQTFADMLQAQRDFFLEHLLLWGPIWAKLVKKEAKTDFYRGLAQLTQGALLAAAAHLEISLPKEVSF